MSEKPIKSARKASRNNAGAPSIDRRKLLAGLGLAGVAGFVAPAVTGLSKANAQWREYRFATEADRASEAWHPQPSGEPEWAHPDFTESDFDLYEPEPEWFEESLGRFEPERRVRRAFVSRRSRRSRGSRRSRFSHRSRRSRRSRRS